MWEGDNPALNPRPLKIIHRANNSTGREGQRRTVLVDWGRVMQGVERMAWAGGHRVVAGVGEVGSAGRHRHGRGGQQHGGDPATSHLVLPAPPAHSWL